MNEKQIIRIDNEIDMLEKKAKAIPNINPQIESFIWGKIEGLKWVKDNL